MKYLKLLGCILICQAAGVIGALSGTSDSVWYQTLTKPWFNPPSFVFGPVWITLYTFMGVALWFIWQSKTKTNKQPAYTFFAIQLVLNSLWSFLFFSANTVFWAGVEIIVLLATIIATCVIFWRIKPAASMLLWPYVLWVSFASFLTWSIWHLNLT